MSSDTEVKSEQSSLVREGVGYDEVYPSRREPNKDVTWSPKRESSTHSPTEEEDEEYKEDEDEEGEEEGYEEEEEEAYGEGEKEEDEEGLDRAVGQVDDNGPRPFILPLIWTVNDFYPSMSQEVFN